MTARGRWPRVTLMTAAVCALAAAGSGGALAAPAAASNPAVDRPSVMQADARAHAGDRLNLPPDPNFGKAAAAPPPGRATAPRAGSTPTYNGAGLNREVFGFAPYWQLSSGALSDVQWDKVSTVAYFGITLGADGNFDTTSTSGKPGWTGWQSAALTSMVNTAHANGDRAVVTITSFSDASISPVVSDPATGQRAITNIINAVKQRGLNGANIDFEGLADPAYPNISQQYANWVASLSQQMKAAVPGAFLTLATYSGAASANDGFFRIDLLAPHVDAFFVMAYDMTFPQSLPNAPLTGPYTYTDTKAVDQYLTKVNGDRSKVILGVPYYGYKASTSRSGFNAPVTAGPSAVQYSDIQFDIGCARGAPDNLTLHWDATSNTPWMDWFSPASGDPCGGNHNSWRETYYDDSHSLGLKYDLVNSRDIRGAGIWALGMDHGYTELWREISRHFAGDRWAAFYSLGGGASGRPAVGTNSDGRLETFVRGTDGAMWHTWQGSAGGGWGGWYSLGGGLAGDPQVVTNADGRLEVFAVGTDGQLWHLWQVAPSGGWTGFYPLGGSLAGRASLVNNGDGRLEAFVRGSDGGTWHLWQVSPGGGWTRPYSLGGNTANEPAATRNPDGRLEAFARRADGAIWHSWQVAPGSGWGQWYSLGGAFTGSPSVIVNPDGRLEVFATGTDHALWHAWQTAVNSGWYPFNTLGGSVAGDPVSVHDADGRLEVFAVDQGGQLDHVFQTAVGGGWVSWRVFSGFTAGSAPSIGRNSDGRLEALVRGSDGGVWHNWQTVVNGGW